MQRQIFFKSIYVYQYLVFRVNVSQIVKNSLLENTVAYPCISLQIFYIRQSLRKTDLRCLWRYRRFDQRDDSLPLDKTTKRHTYDYISFATLQNTVVVSELVFEFWSLLGLNIGRVYYHSLRFVGSSGVVQGRWVLLPYCHESLPGCLLKTIHSFFIRSAYKFFVPVSTCLLLLLLHRLRLVDIDIYLRIYIRLSFESTLRRNVAISRYYVRSS